jgi:hypothetical protein
VSPLDWLLIARRKDMSLSKPTFLGILALLVGACSSSSSSSPVGTAAVKGDSGVDASAQKDALGQDDASMEASADATLAEAADGHDAPIGIDASPDQKSEDAISPGAELTIEQIYVGGGWMGEASIVVGPDGTSVLIDTGSGLHAPVVFDAIERNVGARAIDWVILTHFHEDHLGGFDKLFRGSTVNGNNPASLNRGMVTRGMVDVGADNVAATDFGQVCDFLNDPAHSSLRHDLCWGPAQAPCDASTAGAPWAATSCDGLRKGVLDDPSDDAEAKLSTIRLGGGASITFFAANAWVAAGEGVESAQNGGLSVGEGGNGPENGRSIGAVVRWGNFSYVFAGDLTGEGASDNPDVESFIADRAASILEQPGGPFLFASGMMDMMHVSHHGYNSSTNQAWVDWLMPADGQARNVLVGTNKNYLLTPFPKVVGRIGPRIGGGYIWVTEQGTGGTSHPRMKVAKGSVVVRVKDQGAAYAVAPRTGGIEGPAELFVSVAP